MEVVEGVCSAGFGVGVIRVDVVFVARTACQDTL